MNSAVIPKAWWLLQQKWLVMLAKFNIVAKAFINISEIKILSFLSCFYFFKISSIGNWSEIDVFRNNIR